MYICALEANQASVVAQALAQSSGTYITESTQHQSYSIAPTRAPPVATGVIQPELLGTKVVPSQGYCFFCGSCKLYFNQLYE